MLRFVCGIIAGFFLWLSVWFGNEAILSALWPKFNAQQQAFQDALDKGGAFQPETIFLLTHVVSGAIAALLSGFLTSLIAGENKRSPLIVGLLLTTLGVLKAVLSWQLVPVWYHLTFTAMLLPLALVGARLRNSSPTSTP
jgi:hypothetical protein